MLCSFPPSNTPAGRRRRARLDRHAELQTAYRTELRDRNAPRREHFGIAALDVCLTMCRHDELTRAADAIVAAIVGRLVRAGFDPEEAERRLWAMVAHVDRDRAAWLARREFETKRAAEKAKQQGGD